MLFRSHGLSCGPTPTTGKNSPGPITGGLLIVEYFTEVKPQPSNSWLPLYCALGVVWGCSFIFIKLGLEFLTPFGVAFGRCLLGAVTLIVIVLSRKLNFPRQLKIWLHLWFVSFLLNSIPGVLFALAETKVTSILAGILNATTPLMTIAVIFLAFREEKPKAHHIDRKSTRLNSSHT